MLRAARCTIEREVEAAVRHPPDTQSDEHSDQHEVHPTLRRVIVGIDFQPPSIDALQWVAQTLAPESELILVHATHADSESAAVTRLRTIADELDADRAVRVEVRQDRPAAALAYFAEATGADMVVVGPHGGRESIPGIGSTAERLIRMSPIPVLLVARPRAHPIRHLLIAADQVDLTTEVLRWADVFARREGVQVTLAHVFDPRFRGLEGWKADSVRPEANELHGYPKFGDFVQETEGWLSGLARELTGSGRVELSVSVGEPGHELVALAERADAELIVMGRRGRWRRVPAVIGSTASTVLRGAPCPVLIVVDPPDARFDPWDVEH